MIKPAQELLQWETLDNSHHRLKVPGGWIMKAYEEVTHDRGDSGMDQGWDFRVSICFVPDAKHEWLSVHKILYNK